jgi:hypothetical protein
VAALDLFAIVSIIVFFYTYLAGQTWVVGQDSFWRYIDPLNALVGLTPSQALNTSPSHGVYVVFLYLTQSNSYSCGLSTPNRCRYPSWASHLTHNFKPDAISYRGKYPSILAAFAYEKYAFLLYS